MVLTKLFHRDIVRDMASKNPFTFQTNRKRFATLPKAVQSIDKLPPTSLTQSGSSRTVDRGSRVAATDGIHREPTKRNKN